MVFGIGLRLPYVLNKHICTGCKSLRSAIGVDYGARIYWDSRMPPARSVKHWDNNIFKNHTRSCIPIYFSSFSERISCCQKGRGLCTRNKIEIQSPNSLLRAISPLLTRAGSRSIIRSKKWSRWAAQPYDALLDLLR